MRPRTSTSDAPPSSARRERGAAGAGVDFGAFALDQAPEREATSPSFVALTPGIVFAGRYRLVARIARGGMGSVWSATDERLGREVAIKFMAAELADDDEYRQRFEQEARAAARLVSRHVVSIHDHGVSDGIPYIVLERLEGEDLQRRLRREPRLPLALCARIATHAAKALRAAHDAGIVHRDLKPPNLFLAAPMEGDDGVVVKLLDFGVAKHAGTDGLRTKTGILVGSPHFMSPEQIQGRRDIDARSDLFSLAAVLYRCVVGRVPYDGDMAAVMVRIAREGPPPPSALAPDLPAELDGFFARAMARDRDARFATATEMAEAFVAIVGRDAAVQPRPLPAPAAPPGDAPRVDPAGGRRPSEHPTIVGMATDRLGPPSGAPRSRESDAPTQIVAASQVLGFTEAGGAVGASPWRRDDAPAAPPRASLAQAPGPSGTSGWVGVLVVALLAVLVLLIALLALWS